MYVYYFEINLCIWCFVGKQLLSDNGVVRFGEK